MSVHESHSTTEYRTLFYLPLASSWLSSDSRMRIVATVVRNTSVAINQVDVIQSAGATISETTVTNATNATNASNLVLDVIVAIRCETANESFAVATAMRAILSDTLLVSQLFGLTLRGMPRLHQHSLVYRSAFSRTGYQSKFGVPPSAAGVGCHAATGGCASPPPPSLPPSEQLSLTVVIAVVSGTIAVLALFLWLMWYLFCRQTSAKKAENHTTTDANASEGTNQSSTKSGEEVNALLNHRMARLFMLTGAPTLSIPPSTPSVVYMPLGPSERVTSSDDDE